MSKHYIFFTRRALPLPNVASQVQVAHSANAAANLGYSTVLVYIYQGQEAINPIQWLRPFHPEKPGENMVKAYNIQDKLKVVKLPMPWPIDRGWGGKWTSSSTVVSKYYFPFHILPHAKIVHTRDWNFLEVAIKHGVPVIYEQNHHNDRKFDPKIVKSHLFQISVTVAETVRESMIENGMPREKIITIHSGYNQVFSSRDLLGAKKCREQLVGNGKPMVVYAGGLYWFKGVDMLIDVAKELPQVQFVIASGDSSQVQAYQKQAKDKEVINAQFLGYIQQNKLVNLLQAADILAHPHCMSQAATFSSPLKFFDYLASGTPIVATKIPILKEFHSCNAIVEWCEPDNPIAFAQCIQKVLLTHPRKEEGYIKSIEYAKEFSYENRISKIMSYVDESIRPEKVGIGSSTYET